MDGLELGIRFSFITNSLYFCGPREGKGIFLRYLEEKDNREEVEEVFRKFEGLYPYFESIAEKNNKDPFDYEVVEAYWIGNELLDRFNKQDSEKIITKLTTRGLPPSFAKKLIKRLPEGFVPHHDFNVLFVGVGATTGSVETNIRNMDNCRIAWGEVLDVLKTQIIVKTNVLKKEKEYFLKEDERKTIVYSELMLPEIKKGDKVAIHWGYAGHILTKEQKENLKKYTKKVRDVMNTLADTA